MTFVGIDIGQAFLECAATAPVPALPRRVPNTGAGITRLVAALSRPRPDAGRAARRPGPTTARCWRPCSRPGSPTVAVNPAQVAAFRQARLGREKTDRADAKLLARFAAVHDDELRRAEPGRPDPGAVARPGRLPRRPGGRADPAEEPPPRQRLRRRPVGDGAPGSRSGRGRGAAARTSRRRSTGCWRAARGRGAAGAVRGRAARGRGGAGLSAGRRLGRRQGGRRLRRSPSHAASSPGSGTAAGSASKAMPGLRRYLYLAATTALRHDAAPEGRSTTASSGAASTRPAPSAPSCTSCCAV